MSRTLPLLRVEHHWVGADESALHIPGLAISDYRYWVVDGTWSNSIASPTVNYNGSTTIINNTDAYLYQTLIKKRKTAWCWSIAKAPEADWQLWPTYTKNMGNKQDRRGTILINGLKKGQ